MGMDKYQKRKSTAPTEKGKTMTDRERLLQILNVAIFPHDGEDPLEAVTDYLLDNGVTFATDNSVGSKWIPVSERLPTPYVDVITCRHDLLARETTIGKEYITISDNEIPSWSQDYRTWKSKVTHWMPLPEPPKEVDNGR